jgi:hypothetical protein
LRVSLRTPDEKEIGIKDPKTEATETSCGSGSGTDASKTPLQGVPGASFGPNLSQFATAEA